MAEKLIESGEALNELHSTLLTVSNELLDERDAAVAANDKPKVDVAQKELERIKVVLATVQGVINRREAMRLDALATRLQESIAAQRAVGLSAARRALEDLVGRLRAPAGFDARGGSGAVGRGAQAANLIPHGMSSVAPAELALLLGVKPPRRTKGFTSLDLSEAVVRGLPVEAVDRLSALIAPGDGALRNRIVPKATLARRQRTAERKLSAQESDRVARLGRLWTFAVSVWQSQAAAQRFLTEAHPLLGGRVPIDIAIESEIGTRAVEDLLGRLKYGSAA